MLLGIEKSPWKQAERGKRQKLKSVASWSKKFIIPLWFFNEFFVPWCLKKKSNKNFQFSMFKILPHSELRGHSAH